PPRRRAGRLASPTLRGDLRPLGPRDPRVAAAAARELVAVVAVRRAQVGAAEAAARAGEPAAGGMAELVDGAARVLAALEQVVPLEAGHLQVRDGDRAERGHAACSSF